MGTYKIEPNVQMDVEVSNGLARYSAIAEVTAQIQGITFHGYA